MNILYSIISCVNMPTDNFIFRVFFNHPLLRHRRPLVFGLLKSFWAIDAGAVLQIYSLGQDFPGSIDPRIVPSHGFLGSTPSTIKRSFFDRV